MINPPQRFMVLGKMLFRDADNVLIVKNRVNTNQKPYATDYRIGNRPRRIADSSMGNSVECLREMHLLLIAAVNVDTIDQLQRRFGGLSLRTIRSIAIARSNE